MEIATHQMTQLQLEQMYFEITIQMEEQEASVDVLGEDKEGILQ